MKVLEGIKNFGRKYGPAVGAAGIALGSLKGSVGAEGPALPPPVERSLPEGVRVGGDVWVDLGEAGKFPARVKELRRVLPYDIARLATSTEGGVPVVAIYVNDPNQGNYIGLVGPETLSLREQ